LKPDHLSRQQARWLAISAQGLGGPRARALAQRRDVLRAIARLGVLQLDAINVLERTQFLVLFSRLGAYDVARLHDLTGPGGALFEYWGHAASVLPVEYQPLFRWRMAEHRTAWDRSGYVAAVLEEVRDHGPLPASKLADPRPNQGEWWDRRSAGRRALEFLFTIGELAAWRSPSFERIYDLPSRVIPAGILDQPTPEVDEAHRILLLHAAAAIGVGTTGDLADYFRIKPKEARPRIAELASSGALRPVAVEGWSDVAYCLPEIRPRAPRGGRATFLSPFDSLIWERSRTRRLFGFDYRIEVYTRPPERQHGYYVLPVLLGDLLVGRLDLKADRQAGKLRVPAAYLEPGVEASSVVEAISDELDAMRAWLGLAAVEVGSRGDLAAALRATLATARRR
jgi:uncharacterized protein YcaQ